MFNLGQQLAWGDVAVDNIQNLGMIHIYLKQSNTNQTSQGAHIILGRTNSVVGYLAMQGAQPRSFFLTSRGEPFLKHVFVVEVCQILGHTGFHQYQYATAS